MSIRRSVTCEYQSGEVEAMMANRDSEEGGWGGRSVMVPSAPRVAETSVSRSGSTPSRKLYRVGVFSMKS